MRNPSRRQFLSTSCATASMFAGKSSLLAQLTDPKDTTALVPDDIQLTADIAPLVRKIEVTPQEQIVEVMIDELRKGMTYRRFLAAIFLAAARLNVSPHQVYAVHSAHQLSLELPHEDRFLPLFRAVYALHSGKGQGPRYPRLSLSPSGPNAAADLDDAMGKFDHERAQAALLTLCRAEGAKTAWGRLWPYVGRNSSNIGHRAIAFVQSWRTLETIGWRHAETLVPFVMRVLNNRFAPPRYPTNLARSARIKELPYDWAGQATDKGATVELLAQLHRGNGDDACRWTFDSLKRRQVQARSVWDAIFLAAGELMLRFDSYEQLSLRPLHTTTSMNALHYAFHCCGDSATRLLTLLMAVDWTSGFVATELERGKLRTMKITDIPVVDVPDEAADAVAEIFSRQPLRSYDNDRKLYVGGYDGPREVMDEVSRMAFSFGRTPAEHAMFIATARQMTCRKATTDAHDVKFPAAIFENYESVSPIWRPHLLATSMQHMHGSRMKDNPAVEQARQALS